ncbi:hypothetical protein CRUP_032605 [Coryphaenoides rupestris]|nr:hypothetical protein CRUP_032605 [Coryphaenoides rupestris]
MEVRYGAERDTMVLKSVLKDGKEGKESSTAGLSSKSLLKEPQDSFQGSGPGDGCENGRGTPGTRTTAAASWSERTRTSFTAEQLYRLEMEFQRCQYVVGRERTELARQLNLSETQVKVWFQNRRTKQKKDQGKDSELRSVVSETAATCSVLRLLEHGRLLTPPGLPGLLPHCGGGPGGGGSLGAALRGPSLSGNGGGLLGGGGGSAGAAGGSPPLPVVSSSGTVVGGGVGGGGVGGGGGASAHGLFGFPMPSLLGGVAGRLAASPLAMAGSLAGNLQELSARYLSSSAFEPYSRTNGKEALDKKLLE